MQISLICFNNLKIDSCRTFTFFNYLCFFLNKNLKNVEYQYFIKFKRNFRNLSYIYHNRFTLFYQFLKIQCDLVIKPNPYLSSTQAGLGGQRGQLIGA